MDVNTQKMMEYASFLDENSRKIVALCKKVEEKMAVAAQCMDQQSGRAAAARLAKNVENIKKSVPVSDDASQRLKLAKKLVDDAGNVFGGRS